MNPHRNNKPGSLPSWRNSAKEHPRPQKTLWISAVILTSFFIWAWQSEIEQVTRAQGQVISSARTQIIQFPDGGVLQEMLVKQGEPVEKGQLLARLDKTKVEALYLESRAKAAALRATLARLNAEVFGGEPQFPEELDEYPIFRENQLLLLRKRRTAIKEELAALDNILSIARRELDMMEPLLEKGDVSMAEVLKLERQVADLQAQSTNKKNKYLQDTQAELSKIQEDVAGAEQLLAQRKNQLDHVEITAPVRGIVKNVSITTLGGVIKPGEEVMQIVPVDENLVVEVKVNPSDIAFLKPGLSANVKIDAYDFAIYGSLNGTLKYISADTLTEDLKQGEQAYYRAQVETQGKHFTGRPSQDLEIQPGMTATVEIKTGSNTILNFLLKPITKTLNESLGER